MEAVGTNGPIVYAEIDTVTSTAFSAQGQVGDLVPDSDNDGFVTLKVTVVAAPWIPTHLVSIYVNGGDQGRAEAGNGAEATGNHGAKIVEVASIVGTTSTDPYVASRSATSTYVRLQKEFTIDLTASRTAGTDAWLVVEVLGFVDGDGGALGNTVPALAADHPYRALIPRSGTDKSAGVAPLAVGFTNPIFIDLHGDGQYDPPGVPANVP